MVSSNNSFFTREDCRLCKSHDLELVIELGTFPHAGDFLRNKAAMLNEKKYPLRIFYCKNCSLLQVIDIVSSDIHFKDYRYRSSVVLKNHFEKLAKLLSIRKGDFIVEIGSNDGVLLSPLQKRGARVLGVDPAKNIAQIAIEQGVPTIVNYFTEKLAGEILREHGKADLVIANNVLAHIDDLDTVFAGIKKILKSEGTLIFEVHYLLELIDKLQYDFFYTEHLCYYMLHTLKLFLNKYNFIITDVELIPIHSGSIRIFAKQKNSRVKESKNVKYLLNKELEAGLLEKSTYLEFARKINNHKKELRKLLLRLKHEGKRVVGYGASGRANTVLNTANIRGDLLTYIVDASPERYNRFTPGTHIPIVPPEVFRNDKVDYAVLFAWSYMDRILKIEQSFLKKGGKFILPFPLIRIVPESE